MASTKQPCLSDLKNAIPSILQSTAIAYTTLGTGIEALGQCQKVAQLLENVICSLRAEHQNYDDLLKVLTGLAVQYKKLYIETKCHVRTIKEQACNNAKIVEEAKKQLLTGKGIANYVGEIEKTAKTSLTDSEDLRAKYDVIIYQVKDCCTQAKAGYERNEHKADIAEKSAGVGILGGIGVGGGFIAFQVATKALAVFGLPGAIAGGTLGLVGGSLLGGMAGGLPFATAEVLFRKYAEKFKILDVTLNTIDKILLENFEVLTEICRLLGRLKAVSKDLSEAEVNAPTQMAEPFDNLDDSNINFLLCLHFDELKHACENLERNCEYLLDDMPLKAVTLPSTDSNASLSPTVNKAKNKYE